MKCDTAKTDKRLLLDDGVRAGWCRRCYREFLRSEDVYPRGLRCHACKVIHREVRMIEKLEGWLCRTCAKEYEQKQLREEPSTERKVAA